MPYEAQPLAELDPAAATTVQIREWAVSVRTRIPEMTEDELNQVDALLIALRTRLRQLGQDIDETERSRILAWKRKGELLGPPKAEFRGNQHTASAALENGNAADQRDRQERARARLLAKHPEAVEEVLSGPKPSLNKAINLAKRQEAAAKATKVAERMAAEIETRPLVIVDDLDDELPEVDEPEPPAALSNWWQLGRHLLYCGDSTDPEFVERTRGARLAFADPPYNAGKADWDHGFVWAHDYLADSAEVVLVTPGISAVADFFAVTRMPYRWSIAAHITNGMTRGALGFGNWIYTAVFSNARSIHRNAQDHMALSVDASSTPESGHESRKPARLLVNLIDLFTDEGDTVVDPFLGSGTTLFAADQTGRACIGAELNPTYQAEIIARYGAGAVRLP